MGATKYPIIDRDVKLKMLGACNDDEERGLVLLLLNSGMHPLVFSSAREKGEKARERPKIIRDGKERMLSWKRPKTNRSLISLHLPKDDILIIEKFLTMRPKSNKHYDEMLRRIGEKAGFDDVSCMTLRHTYCIFLLRPKDQGGKGMTIYEVPHWMGCTLDVVARNYSIMSGNQLMDEAG